MNHYWNGVDGYFAEADTQFYKWAIDNASSPAHFVEVGSWKGKSASFMGVEIINSGKQIQFDCVDTWLGAPEHREGSTIAGGVFVDADVVAGRLFEVFTNNMKPLEGHYRAVRLESVEAAATYEDNSLDFVFIDADHTYDAVKSDILAWLPKIKINGIISGHDYDHPPVKQAVHELLDVFGVNNAQGAPWWAAKK